MYDPLFNIANMFKRIAISENKSPAIFFTIHSIRVSLIIKAISISKMEFSVV